MKITMYRCGDIVFKKKGDNKYIMCEPIKLIPVKTELTEKELKKICEFFDTFFDIRFKSEVE